MFTYCPQCKSEKLNFVNQHHWLCQQCQFMYFHNIAAAVAGIIEYNGQVLLTVRAKNPAKGLYGLPGGFVDPKESLEQALTRELFEELGIAVKQTEWQYFSSNPNTYVYQDITYNTQDCVFICKLTTLPSITLEEEEIASAQWFKKDAIPFDKIAFPSLKKALLLYVGATN